MPLSERDLDEKLDVKKFRQFLRDLRDLAQAADRRISARRAAVAERVAASPFPVTPDMLAYAREARQRAEGLSRHDKGPEVGYTVDLLKRAVAGPYGATVVVDLRSGQSDGGAHGVAKSIPHERSDAGRAALIFAHTDYGNHPDDPSSRLAWDQFEEAIVHELIHVFDPKLRKSHLRTQHHPAMQARRGQPQPYLEQPVERTAYEGQLHQRIQTMHQRGVPRKRALEYVAKMASDPGLTARTDYEVEVMEDPRRKRDFLTRLTKMVDRIYGAVQ